jgi:archaemetzincin
MIRVVALDPFEPAMLKQLTKTLYTAFGVGAELSAEVSMPTQFAEPFDADKLLMALPKVHAFNDDKVLFLTKRKLAPRKLLSGEAPTFGVSQYGGQRCILTTAHVKSPEDNVKLVARFALQEVGHCFGLHHCLDPRCSMYPPWTPSFLLGDCIFCTFCREKSEGKIRGLKS